MLSLLGRGAAPLRFAAARSAGRAAAAAAAPLGACAAPLRPAAPHRRYADAAVTRAMAETGYAETATLEGSTKVFANWTIYKTKAALTVKFIKPSWQETNGANGKGYILDREGKMLIEFAASTGERSYGWDQKIVVALSAEELGKIFSEPDKEQSFFHDPNMMDPTLKGSNVKTVRWSPAPDGNAWFLTASTGSNASANKHSVSVPITKPEYYVFESLGRYAIPHLLGIDVVLST